MESYDFIIQIINVDEINGRKIVIHYTSVSNNDISTYKKAVNDLYSQYKDDLLCFFGTTTDEQRDEIAETLVDIDKLLIVPTDITTPNCYRNIIIVYIIIIIDR